MCYAPCLTEGKPYPLIRQGFCVRELVAVDARNVREESMFTGQNTGLSTTAAQSGTVHGLDLSVNTDSPCPRSVRRHRHGHNQDASANMSQGVAGIVTQGLIDFMTDRSFLHTPVPGYDAYTFQNFIGVALLGVWIIFSTIAAPVIIQRSISDGFLAGSFLLSGAASAGRAAVSTGATTGASVASAGTGKAMLAGAAADIAAATESLAGISGGLGSGSMVNSLSQIRPRGAAAPQGARKLANPPFPADDLTGDKTVTELLRKTRNPPS